MTTFIPPPSVPLVPIPIQCEDQNYQNNVAINSACACASGVNSFKRGKKRG